MTAERVFLTGGTGFTGSYVAEHLLAGGYRVRALVRPTSDLGYLPVTAERIIGTLEDTEGLARAMRGCDTLVNVASIGFGLAPGIVAAAHAAGIRRSVFFSTTSLFTTLNARSKSTRLAAEDMVTTSELRWTILRPTMIFGSARDRNMWRLVRFIRHSPVVPVFGSGESLQQPVYVDDLAIAVVQVLKTDATIGRAYNLPGAAPVSYNQVIDTIASLLGKRVRRVHLPPRPFVALLRAWAATGIPAPLKAEQIQRLNEDKAFDYAEASRDFGYAPRPFEEGIRQEIAGVGPAVSRNG